MWNRTMVQQGVLISCCFVVGYYLLFGSHGFVDYCKLRYRLSKTNKKIEKIDKDIVDLENLVDNCQKNPYELERVARYDFGIGFTNEIVYVLPKAIKS
jgi:cell division protein FtsB